MKSQFSHNTRSAKIIQKEINIVGIIKKKEEIRKVIEPKTETVNYVCHATLHDDFGSIPITLWKYDVLRVSNFDEITITNGYSYVFQGEIRISAGYEGTLTTKQYAKISGVSRGTVYTRFEEMDKLGITQCAKKSGKTKPFEAVTLKDEWEFLKHMTN